MPNGPVDRTARARQLRQTGNPPEVILWRHLKARRLHGLKFRRQEPMGPYFADFYCGEARLAVEIDGVSHLDRDAYDRARDDHLRGHGVTVLRIPAVDIHQNLESVLIRIREAAGLPKVDCPAGASSRPGRERQA
jgi:very-short-patch-repair endonuclease